jgi:hypothetical protein
MINSRQGFGLLGMFGRQPFTGGANPDHVGERSLVQIQPPRPFIPPRHTRDAAFCYTPLSSFRRGVAQSGSALWWKTVGRPEASVIARNPCPSSVPYASCRGRKRTYKRHCRRQVGGRWGTVTTIHRGRWFKSSHPDHFAATPSVAAFVILRT